MSRKHGRDLSPFEQTLRGLRAAKFVRSLPQGWREYSKCWRISGYVEAYLGSSSYPLTIWTNVLSHFLMASQWTQFSGPGGWNDPDSLEIGNGSNDGTNAGTSP